MQGGMYSITNAVEHVLDHIRSQLAHPWTAIKCTLSSHALRTGRENSVFDVIEGHEATIDLL